jgi:hypothetical protein
MSKKISDISLHAMFTALVYAMRSNNLARIKKLNKMIRARIGHLL